MAGLRENSLPASLGSSPASLVSSGTSPDRGIVPDATLHTALGAALLSASADSVTLLDGEGRVLAINPAGAAFLGDAAASALIGQPAEALSPACAGAVRDGIRGALNSGATVRCTTLMTAHAGAEHWFDTTIWPVHGAPPVRVAISCRDATHAHRADIEHQRHAQVVKSIAEGGALGDILTQICRLAEALLPGTRCSVLLHDTATGTLRPGAHPSLPLAYVHAIDGVRAADGVGSCGTAVARGCPVVSADIATDPFWAGYQDLARAHGLAACWSLPLRANGRVVGAFAAYYATPRAPAPDEMARVESCANLAALALEQEEMRHTRANLEARFRSAAELLPCHVHVTRADGKRLYCNSYYQSQTGVPVALLHGEGWRRVLHPDDADAALASWDQALRDGTEWEARFRVRLDDGTYCWFLGRAQPMRDPDGCVTGWVGVDIDIDELVASRELLQRYRVELEQIVEERTTALQETAGALQAEMAQREQAMEALAHSRKVGALGQLAGGVAHDFNNLLSTIMGSFQLIDRRTMDAEVLRLAHTGLIASDRAASLVRRLLSVARQEAPKTVEVDLATALPPLRDLVRHALNDGIRFTLAVDDGIWPILADPGELENAVLNLVLNARDAMPENGTISVMARNRSADRSRAVEVRARDHVLIEVRDNGAGIQPELRDKLFEPFFTTKPRGVGTGLGLAMVRAFVQHAGGDISVDSTVGKGTTISLFLPRAAPAVPDARAEPACAALARGTASVLIVDDDDMVRGITAALLRDAGYQVLEAANGRVALALLQCGLVDLMITDVSMPGMSGKQLAALVREERPGLPILFTTGFGDHADLPGETAIQKPYTGDKLLAAVARGLGSVDDRAARLDLLLNGIRAPLLKTAYRTWRTLRGTAGLPTFGQLTLASRAWSDNCFLVAVAHGSGQPRFQWISAGPVVSANLPNLVNETMAAVPGLRPASSPHSAYQRCAQDGVPDHQFMEVPARGTNPMRFERLVLPAAERGTVTHLVGVVAFE